MKYLILTCLILVSFSSFTQTQTQTQNKFSEFVSQIDKLIIEQPNESFRFLSVQAYWEMSKKYPLSGDYSSMNMSSRLYKDIKKYYAQKALLTINNKDIHWELVSERSSDPARMNVFHDYLVLEQEAKNSLKGELEVLSRNIINEASLTLEKAIKNSKRFGVIEDAFIKALGVSVFAVPTLMLLDAASSLGGLLYPYESTGLNISNLIYALPGGVTFAGVAISDYLENFKSISKTQMLIKLRSAVDKLSEKYGEKLINKQLSALKKSVKQQETYQLLKRATLYKKNGVSTFRFKIPVNLWGDNATYQEGVKELVNSSELIMKFNSCNGKFQ